MHTRLITQIEKGTFKSNISGPLRSHLPRPLRTNETGSLAHNDDNDDDDDDGDDSGDDDDNDDDSGDDVDNDDDDDEKQYSQTHVGECGEESGALRTLK